MPINTNCSMKKSADKITKDYQEILNKFLTIADHHYLSARLLNMYGLYIVALHSAATAIELYLKCALRLQDKDTKIRHDLSEGFKILRIDLDDQDKEFIKELENAYKKKYPDQWEKVVTWKEELDQLDSITCSLRNYIHSIVDGQLQSQDTLKIIKEGDNFSPKISAKYGTLKWQDIFFRANKYYSQFKSF